MAELAQHLGRSDSVAAPLLHSKHLVHLLDLDDGDAHRITDRRVFVDPRHLIVQSNIDYMRVALF